MANSNRDRPGIFNGLSVHLPWRGRSADSLHRDCDLLRVPSPTPVRNFCYKISSASSPTPLSQRDSGYEWDVMQTVRYVTQGPSPVPVLQHHWIHHCLREGRILDEEDDWGGWRIVTTRDPRLASSLAACETNVRNAYATRRAKTEFRSSTPDQRYLKRPRSGSPPCLFRRLSSPARGSVADRQANKPAPSSGANGFTASVSLRRLTTLLPSPSNFPTQGHTPPATPAVATTFEPMERSRYSYNKRLTFGASSNRHGPITLPNSTKPLPISPAESPPANTPSTELPPNSPPSWARPERKIGVKASSGVSPYGCAYQPPSTKAELRVQPRVSTDATSDDSLASVPSSEFAIKVEIPEDIVASLGFEDTKRYADSPNGQSEAQFVKSETPISDVDAARVALQESIPANLTEPHSTPILMPLIHIGLPQIFKLGPNRIQFYVIEAPGCPFLQATILAGGGSITTELSWATYIIVAPGTRAASMRVFGTRRSACARLIHARWVTNSMAAAKLIDPAPYEVNENDRAKLLCGEW
ncbi:hypothetical protein CC85DRAFT_290801 [Cutaneotrichosporon oleaginosum]|uniref:BRCT domain-containing protein n=1 Tax=Cutaneotrichosporon oleaginosum TaxID=879819 RepID=A0A0J0XUK6_9TREE|nr:uncharacterized protein CC85DRAFT_290801 [Cutaneotrichosporon oleaginosum]KLT44750.1 hypothetical protein CC85DRAFT_290801 [Cutaneotrichosporon oleaginosum]TXT07736.1 hypothetical protein COLE_04660 [Cutaneotrichosporon oleaginosum]